MQFLPSPRRRRSGEDHGNDGTQIRIYLNGWLVGSAAQQGPLAAGPGPLRIGATARGERFDGLIDEVRVYDRALTAGETQLDLGTPVSP